MAKVALTSLVCLYLATQAPTLTSSANIVGVPFSGGASHIFGLTAILRELVDRGHSVQVTLHQRMWALMLPTVNWCWCHTL